jgi:hypothetical protein
MLEAAGATMVTTMTNLAGVIITASAAAAGSPRSDLAVTRTSCTRTCCREIGVEQGMRYCVFVPGRLGHPSGLRVRDLITVR